MTVVLHTSDTHLGYHQYHLEDRAADVAAAFEAVIDEAVERGVDAVVHSGDMFHDSNPQIGPLLHAIRQLRRLADADIPFLMVSGNHDTTRDDAWVSVFTEVADAVHLGREPTVVGDVALYGLDYHTPTYRDRLTYEFESNDADHTALVAHGSFSPLVAYGDWSIEDVLSSSTVAFDAALLGDDHTPIFEEVGGTFTTYPGSTERTMADQRDDRGFTLVRFGDDARPESDRIDRDAVCPPGVSYDRVPLDTRPHVYIDIEAEEDDAVAERVRDELGDHDVAGAVVAVTIDGEGEPVAAGPLEAYAKEELGALEARVSDRRRRGSDRVAIDVSFADPDDAVERRRRTLGLSAVVDELEQPVRADTPVDSNLRDRVEEDVEDRIEDDPVAFDPVEPEVTEEELREQADGLAVDASQPTTQED